MRNQREGAARSREPASAATREPIPVTTLTDHVVLLGYGRVGHFVTPRRHRSRIPTAALIEDRSGLS